MSTDRLYIPPNAVNSRAGFKEVCFLEQKKFGFFDAIVKKRGTSGGRGGSFYIIIYFVTCHWDDIHELSCLYSKDLVVDWRQMKRVLALAPWHVTQSTRNYRIMGKLAPVANNFGSDANMTQVR